MDGWLCWIAYSYADTDTGSYAETDLPKTPHQNAQTAIAVARRLFDKGMISQFELLAELDYVRTIILFSEV